MSPPGLIHRAMAWALVAALLTASLAPSAFDLHEAWRLREDAQARLRIEDTAPTLSMPGDAYRIEDLSAERQNRAEAEIALQTLVDTAARTAGAQVLAIRPSQQETLGTAGETAWVQAELQSDLAGLVSLLTDLDAQRPTVLIRALEVRTSPSAPVPDAALTLRIEIGQLWGEAPPNRGGVSGSMEPPSP